MTTLHNIPAFGNFDGLNLPDWDREMIESGFKAISSIEGGWDFLKTYEPPSGEGFMFVRNPPAKMQEIENAVINAYSGHSGASYGCTMRILQSMAKGGWDAFAKESLDEYGPPKPLEKFVKQVKVLDSFLASNPPSDPLAFAEAMQKNEGMRTMIKDIDQQVSAMKDFSEGKMTYAEMRSLCG